MGAIIFWVALFTVATTISIVLIGARDLIEGDITLRRLFSIIFDWRFIIGAGFAFGARLCFVMINNAVHKVPGLEQSSTSITFLATMVSIFFVLLANYFFLGERLSVTQGVGVFVVLCGVYLLLR